MLSAENATRGSVGSEGRPEIGASIALGLLPIQLHNDRLPLAAYLDFDRLGAVALARELDVKRPFVRQDVIEAAGEGMGGVDLALERPDLVQRVRKMRTMRVL